MLRKRRSRRVYIYFAQPIDKKSELQRREHGNADGKKYKGTRARMRDEARIEELKIEVFNSAVVLLFEGASASFPSNSFVLIVHHSC